MDFQLINASYFALMAHTHLALTIGFVFYLWMKHFVGNVSRQGFQSPEYTNVHSHYSKAPQKKKRKRREIWIDIGECVISCHIIHRVLEASSEDSVGVEVGGMETWLLVNLVTAVDSVQKQAQETHIMSSIVVFHF